MHSCMLPVAAIICTTSLAQGSSLETMNDSWVKIGGSDTSDVFFNFSSMDYSNGMLTINVRVFEKTHIYVQKWAYKKGWEFTCCVMAAAYNRATGACITSKYYGIEWSPIIPDSIAESGARAIKRYLEIMEKSNSPQSQPTPKYLPLQGIV